MPKMLFTNNATCLLAVALTNVATTMYVESGKGALFPTITGSDFFLTTIEDAAGNWEIVKVTARTSDTFTIVRNQESSGAKAFATPTTTRVSLRPTAGSLDGFTQKIADETITGKRTYTKIQSDAQGVNVASANNMTLGDDGNTFTITGTTTVYTIATKGVGTVVKLVAADSFQITHHATDMVLPGGANIITHAGAVIVLEEYAVDDWRCLLYLPYDELVRAKRTVSTSAPSGGNDGDIWFEREA